MVFSRIARLAKNAAQSTLLAGLLLAGSLAAPMVASAKETIDVVVDHAKLIRMPREAGTIIIGNPGIADATIQDSRTLVITGKSFGVTNMIVLDKDGEPIADALLTVRGEPVNAVTIYRRTERITYSCSPKCERSLALGDENKAFGAVQSQVQKRNTFANGQ